MKNKFLLPIICILIFLSLNAIPVLAQAPQKISYQAVIFNNENALARNTAVSLRISLLHNGADGDIIFQEVYSPNPVTNGNGVMTVEIGTGTAIIGAFDQIDWASGTYFIKSETDIAGGTNYSISGSSQILSTPYALYAAKSADGFSGNYDDLTNKPVTDGSETKITAGSNVSVTGTGTIGNPYVVNSANPLLLTNSKVVLTNSQTFTVPQGVSKIRVELWGGAGGGAGAGAYSYSYNLLDGGYGGGGGYASQEVDVTPGQLFDVTIGEGGNAGVNALYSNGNYYGDTDGGDGGNTLFSSIKAAGGKGGKRGSFSYYTVNGEPGTDNQGTITAHPSYGGYNGLDIYNGIARSYLADRLFTSKPGYGGNLLSGYSTQPTSGEGGSAVITFIE